MRTVAAKDRSHPLRRKARPDFETGASPVRIADLFCGGGGLTLGIAQGLHAHGRALEVALAVDSDPDALAVYRANFPKAATSSAPIETLVDGDLHAKLTSREKALRKELVEIDITVGGPPCQGHSDLNNHTRRDDPKNDLYLRMVRFARVMEPTAVVIENVPAVRHATTGVVPRTVDAFQDLGYHVDERVVALDHLGLPQRRRRHLLIALRNEEIDPTIVMDAIEAKTFKTRNLAWAIRDLASIKHHDGIDQAPTPSAENLRRMQWMIDHDEWDLPNRLRPVCHRDGGHSYTSMYGRLSWDAPAQTITSGFGSIGQGRYMHPDLPRALTPHEAARIQGFPDYFDFSAVARRASLATMIGNAVPPLLATVLVEELLHRTETI